MAFLIGIDIGTSGVKTVLFDSQCNIISSEIEEYPLYQPKNGWAEQDPEDWWNATCITLKKVLRKSCVNPNEVKAIGLTGQMHSIVALDSNNDVLRRSILWCDQRSDKECDELKNIIGIDKLFSITGNPPLTGFTASKLIWIKNNEPQIFGEIKKILLSKDYIRYKLTGEFATDVSDASGMQFLNIKERNWSSEILSKLGIDNDQLGKVYESHEITGKVSKDASELTGLAKGTPVVAGAGDQAAGAIGNGIVKPGIVSSTIGTSGVVFASINKVEIDNLGRVHTFCHAVPNTWHIMGVTQGAGLSLKWFRDNFCQDELSSSEKLGLSSYDLMCMEASKAEIGSNGLIYLPYLMGERTPHLDSDARGVFFGISSTHKKKHFIRSILEGITFSLRDCLDIIKSMGIQVEEVRIAGGGSNNNFWNQIQTDIFNHKVARLNSFETTALGAAILAGVGIGMYKDVNEACEIVINKSETLQPNAKNNQVYNKYYSVYRNLYSSLKHDFKKLHNILE